MIRHRMLQAARTAPKLLRSSTERVTEFINSKLSGSGGFTGPGGESDLYYTVFGIESLLALRAKLPTGDLNPYLESFGSGESLDFVHLACLIRCRADLGLKADASFRPQKAFQRLEKFRTPEGGYSPGEFSETGTAYGAFLALCAHQDLAMETPDPEGLLCSLSNFRAKDGGYGNRPGLAKGLTPATSAVATVLDSLAKEKLSLPEHASLGKWLLSRCHREGGLAAAEGVPVPDLLSTAVGLHALSRLNVDLDSIREKCIDFVADLWSPEGGFYGHPAATTLDCEYTYYGLLALGHLT